MFNEIDIDGSRNISISELQNQFKTKYDLNVKEILDKIRSNKKTFNDDEFKELRTLENKEQNIEDEISFEQLAGLFFFDFVIIDKFQNDEIRKKCEDFKKNKENLKLDNQKEGLKGIGLIGK